MADISKVVLPNGDQHTIKDSNAYRVGPEVSHRNNGNPSANPAHAILTTRKNALDYQILRAVAGIGDWFYAANKNPDYTITSNYSGRNGTKGIFAISTLFYPSAASTVLLDVDAIASDPFVLTIEKASAITATDVVHLELYTHTLGNSAARLTDYKVELLTTGSTSASGTYSWTTVYERHGVSDNPSGLCITLNPTSYSYLYFKGVRFTIEGATPGSTNPSAWNYNCIDLSLFRLMDQRPAFSAARSVGALDISGGDMYGYARFMHGLEGDLTGNASTATTLKNARSIQTNLASSSAVNFDGSANVTPGVTGTLGVNHGGTGKTSTKDAANAFMNALDTGSSTPVDNDYYISQYVSGGTTTTTYHRRPMSALWEYIKGKISSVLGLTNTSYSGSAAKVNNHTVNKDVPSDAKFTDTWKANSSTSEGYVASGANQANKVWKTNENGVPAWRDDANTTYTAGTNVQISNNVISATDTKYTAASENPLMDGTAAVGTSAKYAREDHVHPSDTTKVDKVSGKGLSTNDYTTTEKNKLAGIAAGAEANVQSDWNVTDTSSDAFIKNKPTIPTKTSDLTNNSNFVSDASYVHTDNNYTTTEKNKLSGIATGAEANVQSDWNVTDTSSDAFIKNKPTIPTVPGAATATPIMDGTAAVGSSTKYAKEDHVHPSDTNKVDKVSGKGLSTNDYTTTEKNKLSGIAEGAEVNVQSDWNVTDTSSDAFIKNKPTIPTDTWKSFYGTCTTAAATKDKVVTVSSDQNFSLSVGIIVGVKFSYTNTYSNATASPITLNVNGTGAKNIWYNTTHSGGGNTGAATQIYGTANRYTWYMYDGTYWVWIHYGVISNSNTVPSAQCETAAATKAKAATCTYFALKANCYLHFNIRYANTSATALTMNVNSTGAKAIYINGTASSASNYTLPAGSYIAFYNGTYWDFRTDGKLPASITGDAATVNGHTVASDVPADAKFTDTTYSEATTSAAGLMSSSDKTKLNGIAAGAEANVQADWNDTDTSSDAFIKNKPTIPVLPANIVTDASYVHTDNNYTTTEKNKLAGIATGAEANVQSDWNETDTTSDAYILNKPNPYLLENFIAIPDGSDLDDYTTPGEYYVSSESTSVSHCPRSGFAFRLRVENNPTASYIKQTFSIRVNNHLYSSQITWFRFYRADTQVWGSWMGDTQHLMGHINLHDDDDLNDFIELGEYECTLTSRALTITNRPSDMNVAFRLRVEAGIQGYNGSSSTYLYRRQTLYPYNSSNIYYTRTYIIEGEGTATWSSWIKCGVPISHASTATTYGQGNASNYGHVKLSDTYSSKVSGGDAAGGIAASQNALYNVYNGLRTGTIPAHNFVANNIGGVATDDNGNFYHNGSTSTSNFWAVKANNGTYNALRVYFETGKIMGGGTTLVWGPGDTATFSDQIAGALITSSQKRVAWSLPCYTSTKVADAQITELSVTLRYPTGGYAYLCYGSSNNQYQQLGSGRVSIWSSSKTVQTNGVSNVDCNVHGNDIYIWVDFVNTLRTGANTTVVPNNAPMSIHYNITLKFT